MRFPIYDNEVIFLKKIKQRRFYISKKIDEIFYFIKNKVKEISCIMYLLKIKLMRFPISKKNKVEEISCIKDLLKIKLMISYFLFLKKIKLMIFYFLFLKKIKQISYFLNGPFKNKVDTTKGRSPGSADSRRRR